MKNKIIVFNTFLIVGFLLIWIIELFKSIKYNSVLFSRDIVNDSRLSPLAGVAILILLSLIFFRLFKKCNLIYAGIVCLGVLSIITIFVVSQDILMYLPFYPNESFIISECILIYYSIFSCLSSILSGVLIVINRNKL